MECKGIKYVVFDVDGTLTDGTINIGNNGEVFKSFCCRDGLGVLMLKKAGIRSVILTSRESDIVIERAKELGIEFVLQGAGDNKVEYLKNFMEEQNIRKHEIAYMGDDINDLESMALCGLKACPADAVEKVKEISDFVANDNGGHGAARGFCEWLLQNM